MIRTLADLDKAGVLGLKSLYPDKTKIMVGMGSCGLAAGARAIHETLSREIDGQGLHVVIRRTGCIGFCEEEPLVDVIRPGMPRITYSHMTPEKAGQLLQDPSDGPMRKDWALCRMEEEEWLLLDRIRKYPLAASSDGKDIPLYQELPFFRKQRKIVLRNCGFIDPENINEYIARGGYRALNKVLNGMQPEQVIEEVKNAGLRGRGGAGFPTGRKWAACRAAKGDVKYVVCNADEGDPGAYMDRSVLEGDPHSVLEGMAIGGFAIGAHQGFIFVRAEYPLAVKTMQAAIKDAEELGLLGKDIMGTGFDFTVQVVRGAGAFVCGEGTALLASVEGRIGEPRQRPPSTTEKGLWGKPTNINNVKTWVNVPAIILRGADWFSGMGTERSKGTMVFSLVGKVKNTGLTEVPMGMSLGDLIYDIGGGIAGDKRLKAVQTGGPSGGCIPATLADLPVDYERLTEVGSMMGSGGMVVMDEETCMVDVARYFLTFTQDESCGKCTPCREGTRRMLEILDRIAAGKGEENDLDLLESLGKMIRKASLCGLGQSAPNPVLTTIQYFRDEYEAHIKHKRCPAIVCKDIIYTPCKYNCPVGTDVPAFVALTAAGKYHEAYGVISQDNPFVVSCSYVCHHPCENRCRSGDIASPISVKALKRFIVDQEMKTGVSPRRRPATAKLEKVAVIGAGPAGLAAAYDLCQWGYDVTVFERSACAGGMLADAIPRYRLPKQVLDLEIEEIKKAGVKIQTNVEIGRQITLDQLFAQGYGAVFVATGAHKSVKLGVPGEDVEGVVDALDFLKAANLGKQATLGRRVAVVGGGNAAIDAARTARRLGCESVSIIYRRTKEEMPAITREVEAGLEEGVHMELLAAPTKVLAENGRLTGVECCRMELAELDESGRRRPVRIPGTEFTIPLDSLIPAIGQQPDLSFLNGTDGFQTSRSGTLAVDPETLSTDREGVFAGGDVVLGPSTIADSIAQGKLAAVSIRKYLRGESLAREYKVAPPSQYVEPLELSEDEVAALERPQMPCLAVEKRIACFDIVELGLSETDALNEAKRCLRCDLEKAATGI
ncbi:MAG TPA: FAD-dependent oxidoreductase [Armatimonadota bacterium]|nr:FAD-dependent oxidoreductase [Armatimonadota bacterium]